MLNRFNIITSRFSLFTSHFLLYNGKGIIFLFASLFLFFLHYIYPATALSFMERKTVIQRFSSLPELKKEARLNNIWRDYRESLSKGDMKAIKDALDRLYQLKLDLGIKNLFNYSNSLLMESFVASEVGELELVELLIDYAERLSPISSSPHLARARIIWSHDHFAFLKILKELYKGFSLYLANFYDGLRNVTNLVFILYSGLLLTFLFFIVFLLICRFRLIGHFFFHLIPSGVPHFLIYILLLLCLIAPFIAVSPGIGVTVWVLCCTLVVKKREMVIIIGFCLFMIMTPFFLRIFSSLLLSIPSAPLEDIVKVRDGFPVGSDLKTLSRFFDEGKGSSTYLFYLALAGKRFGDLEVAEEFYKEILGRDPEDVQAINNLANVYAVREKFDKSVSLYKRGIRLGTDAASLHYNLAQVYRKRFETVKSEREARRAAKLDRELVTYYEDIYSENPNRFVIDEDREFLSLVHEGLKWNRKESDRIAKSIWLNLFIYVPLNIAHYALAGFSLLILLVYIFLKRINLPRECRRCGEAFCMKCFGERFPGKVYTCPQCFYIFERKIVLEVKSKIAREFKIQAYNRRRKWGSVVLNIPFMGMGHILNNAPIRGFVFLFIEALLFLSLLFYNGLIRDTFVLDLMSAFQMTFVIIFFGISYLFSQLNNYRNIR